MIKRPEMTKISITVFVLFFLLLSFSTGLWAGEPVPVYRFFSPVFHKQFLTLDRTERDHLLAHDANWRYDGVAFYAFRQEAPGLVPVYRFWSDVYKSHFFTIDPAEKEATERNPEWRYEGIAFYVYPLEASVSGVVPVFRLWNTREGGHFYTTFPAEREVLKGEGFRYEHEVFKVYPSYGGQKVVGVHLHPFQDSWRGSGPLNDYLRKGILPFNRETGKKHAIVMFFAAWENGEGMYSFGPRHPDYGEKYEVGWIAGQIIDAGAIPMITWEPWREGGGLDQPAYRLRRILAGDYDSYIRRFARDVRRFRAPVLIRFAHEMNGDYYPWACSLNENNPALYREAFRHVRRLFQEEGATNAYFVWSPNYASPPRVKAPCNDLEALYPGDDVVDFIGVSVYNWGSDTSRGPGWRDLDWLLRDFLDHMARYHPDKWVIVAETGCAHDRSPQEVAAWIKKAYQFLATRGNVAAVVYFNDFAYHNPGFSDFRVTTGHSWPQFPVPEEITQAYREAIRFYLP